MENTTVTTPVESSPAAPAAVIEVPKDPAAYQEWRKTGKLPDPAEKSEESAPSKKSSETAEAPEARKQGKQEQERPRSTAETRLNELLADLKRAGLSPAELKTFKRQVQQEAKEAQPKAEHTDKPAAKLREAPKKPDSKTWTGTYEELEEAREAYYEALADYKSEEAIRKYETKLTERQQTAELNGKLEDARGRYGAEADQTIAESVQAIFPDETIHPTIKALINDSPVMVDLLYVAGSKPEEFQALLEQARTNPGAAIRQIVALENMIQDTRGTGDKKLAGVVREMPARDESSGKFLSKAPADKKPSQAPPPPNEVSGRSGAPLDDVQAAWKSGDFRSFMAAANRRDIARRTGK